MVFILRRYNMAKLKKFKIGQLVTSEEGPYFTIKKGSKISIAVCLADGVIQNTESILEDDICVGTASIGDKVKFKIKKLGSIEG